MTTRIAFGVIVLSAVALAALLSDGQRRFIFIGIFVGWLFGFLHGSETGMAYVVKEWKASLGKDS